MQNNQIDVSCTTKMQPVFPGIMLIYLNAHGKAVHHQEVSHQSTDVLEVFHCREGRMELNIGGDYCYVSPGDLLIARAEKISSEVYLPLQHSATDRSTLFPGQILHLNISFLKCTLSRIQ